MAIIWMTRDASEMVEKVFSRDVTFDRNCCLRWSLIPLSDQIGPWNEFNTTHNNDINTYTYIEDLYKVDFAEGIEVCIDRQADYTTIVNSVAHD